MVCACGERNNVNHAMICQLGEYIHLRHINLRDTAAELQRSNGICKDDVRCRESCPIWCTFSFCLSNYLVITKSISKTEIKRATSDISLRFIHLLFLQVQFRSQLFILHGSVHILFFRSSSCKCKSFACTFPSSSSIPCDYKYKDTVLYY